MPDIKDIVLQFVFVNDELITENKVVGDFVEKLLEATK